jgi:hypothetical protein
MQDAQEPPPPSGRLTEPPPVLLLDRAPELLAPPLDELLPDRLGELPELVGESPEDEPEPLEPPLDPKPLLDPASSTDASVSHPGAVVPLPPQPSGATARRPIAKAATVADRLGHSIPVFSLIERLRKLIRALTE